MKNRSAILWKAAWLLLGSWYILDSILAGGGGVYALGAMTCGYFAARGMDD